MSDSQPEMGAVGGLLARFDPWAPFYVVSRDVPGCALTVSSAPSANGFPELRGGIVTGPIQGVVVGEYWVDADGRLRFTALERAYLVGSQP